jgi:tight adherence protein B
MLVVVLISSLVFVGVLSAANLMYWSHRTRQDIEARDLARRLGTLADNPETSLFVDQQDDPWSDILGGLGERLEALIRESSVDYNLSGLLMRMAAFGIIGAFLTSVFIKGVAGLVGLFFGTLPIVILSSRAEERAKALSEQLPDGLDLVARSLQAGHGLSDAMRMCAVEMVPPIAHEFGRVHEEHNLGRDMRDCLNDLCLRNPRNFDLRIFVSSVILQRETGGNLIEILNNISKTIRDRFIFQRKVKALTAESRLSAIILGGLPFVVTFMIMMMRPEYLNPLVTDPIGHWLLGFCFISFTSGVLVMRRLSQIEL